MAGGWRHLVRSRGSRRDSLRQPVLRLPRSGLSPQHLAGRVCSVRFRLDGEPAAGKRCDGWPRPMVTAAMAMRRGGRCHRHAGGPRGGGDGSARCRWGYGLRASRWAVACLWRTCARFCPHLRHHGVGIFPPHHRRVTVGLSAAVAGGQLTITAHANDLPFGLPTLVSYTACRAGAVLRQRKPKYHGGVINGPSPGPEPYPRIAITGPSHTCSIGQSSFGHTPLADDRRAALTTARAR
jgi:hypothetical protein